MEKQIPARNTSKYCGQYAAAFDAQRIIEIFRDSHRIALSSRNPQTAGDRFALAVEAYHQIMSMDVPNDARAPVQNAMQALADTFPSAVVANEALGLREKAHKLKTPRKRLELLRRALGVVDRARAANPGSAMLEQTAAELRSEIARSETGAT
jgi:hypothetical protein